MLRLSLLMVIAIGFWAVPVFAEDAAPDRRANQRANREVYLKL